MKVWIVVATWFIICWTVVFGSRSVSPNLSVPNYTPVWFSVDSNDSQTYMIFIDELRKLLTDHYFMGFNVLPNNVPLDSEKRFVLIELDSGGLIPILAVDTTNASIIGFRPNTGSDNSYFFKDVPNDVYTSPIFDDSIKHRLPFNGSYAGLEDVGAFRDNVPLGFSTLNQTVYQLAYYDPDTSNVTDTAVSLLVAVQMISEATRFKYIENQIIHHIYEGFVPTCLIISLEDIWVALSYGIQKSTNGKLVPPVTRLDDNCEPFNVSTVDEAEPFISLLLGLDAEAVFWPGDYIKMLVSMF